MAQSNVHRGWFSWLSRPWTEDGAPMQEQPKMRERRIRIHKLERVKRAAGSNFDNLRLNDVAALHLDAPFTVRNGSQVITRRTPKQTRAKRPSPGLIRALRRGERAGFLINSKVVAADEGLGRVVKDAQTDDGTPVIWMEQSGHGKARSTYLYYTDHLEEEDSQTWLANNPDADTENGLFFVILDKYKEEEAEKTMPTYHFWIRKGERDPRPEFSFKEILDPIYERKKAEKEMAEREADLAEKHVAHLAEEQLLEEAASAQLAPRDHTVPPAMLNQALKSSFQANSTNNNLDTRGSANVEDNSGTQPALHPLPSGPKESIGTSAVDLREGFVHISKIFSLVQPGIHRPAASPPVPAPEIPYYNPQYLTELEHWELGEHRLFDALFMAHYRYWRYWLLYYDLRVVLEMIRKPSDGFPHGDQIYSVLTASMREDAEYIDSPFREDVEHVVALTLPEKESHDSYTIHEIQAQREHLWHVAIRLSEMSVELFGKDNGRRWWRTTTPLHPHVVWNFRAAKRDYLFPKQKQSSFQVIPLDLDMGLMGHGILHRDSQKVEVSDDSRFPAAGLKSGEERTGEKLTQDVDDTDMNDSELEFLNEYRTTWDSENEIDYENLLGSSPSLSRMPPSKSGRSRELSSNSSSDSSHDTGKMPIFSKSKRRTRKFTSLRATQSDRTSNQNKHKRKHHGTENALADYQNEEDELGDDERSPKTPKRLKKTTDTAYKLDQRFSVDDPAGLGKPTGRKKHWRPKKTLDLAYKPDRISSDDDSEDLDEQMVKKTHSDPKKTTHKTGQSPFIDSDAKALHAAKRGKKAVASKKSSTGKDPSYKPPPTSPIDEESEEDGVMDHNDLSLDGPGSPFKVFKKRKHMDATYRPPKAECLDEGEVPISANDSAIDAMEPSRKVSRKRKQADTAYKPPRTGPFDEDEEFFGAPPNAVNTHKKAKKQVDVIYRPSNDEEQMLVASQSIERSPPPKHVQIEAEALRRSQEREAAPSPEPKILTKRGKSSGKLSPFSPSKDSLLKAMDKKGDGAMKNKASSKSKKITSSKEIPTTTVKRGKRSAAIDAKKRIDAQYANKKV